MDTSSLLEGFHRGPRQSEPKAKSDNSIVNQGHNTRQIGDMLNEVGTLWDASEYAEEFSVEKFVNDLS